VNIMFKCEICGLESKSIRGLSVHISNGHKIKTEEYYLKYINPEKGKCKTCGKNTRFNNLTHGYSKFCSIKCMTNNIDIKNKRNETFIKNWGGNPMQNKEVKERHKETCIKNWGVKYPSQNKEIQNRKKETCIKNWGVGNPSQNKEIQNRKKETSMKNWGYKSPNQSEKVKNKKKETCMKNLGVEYPMQNPEVCKKRDKSILKNNNGIHPNKLTYQKCKERYPDLVKIEGLIEGPNGEIMGHCKNSSCKNSKENGGYFEVTSLQIMWRNDGINAHDTDNFYCCEECKHSCPLYGRSATELHNLMNENPETSYTQAELSTWKEEVFLRQKIEYDIDYNFCEHCQSKENLHAHHIQPIKLYPGYALDPDNGIIFCEDCHYEIGHETGTECSTGNLASKICK